MNPKNNIVSCFHNTRLFPSRAFPDSRILSREQDPFRHLVAVTRAFKGEASSSVEAIILRDVIKRLRSSRTKYRIPHCLRIVSLMTGSDCRLSSIGPRADKSLLTLNYDCENCERTSWRRRVG